MRLIPNDSRPAAGRITDAAPAAVTVGRGQQGWKPNNAQGVNNGPTSGEQTITSQVTGFNTPPFHSLSRPASPIDTSSAHDRENVSDFRASDEVAGGGR